jgi:hypothetical protein
VSDDNDKKPEPQPDNSPLWPDVEPPVDSATTQVAGQPGSGGQPAQPEET